MPAVKGQWLRIVFPGTVSSNKGSVCVHLGASGGTRIRVTRAASGGHALETAAFSANARVRVLCVCRCVAVGGWWGRYQDQEEPKAVKCFE